MLIFGKNIYITKNDITPIDIKILRRILYVSRHRLNCLISVSIEEQSAVLRAIFGNKICEYVIPT